MRGVRPGSRKPYECGPGDRAALDEGWNLGDYTVQTSPHHTYQLEWYLSSQPAGISFSTDSNWSIVS